MGGSASQSGERSSLCSGHYHVLLLSLMALLLVAPVARVLPFGRDLVNVLFLTTLVFGAVVGRRSRLGRRLRVGLAAFTALLMMLTYVFEHGAVVVTREVLLFAFLLFVLAGILRDVFDAPRVEAGLLSPDYSRPSRAWRALVADLCVVRRQEPTRVDLLLTP